MAKSWVEVWERPGSATYGRKIADLPINDASATVPHSGVGMGQLRIPKDYARTDDILLTDPVTPANGAWSTIKHFSEQGLLYEWLPYPRVPPGQKNDPDIEISGEGIESIVGFARVEPWDWDGSTSFVSTFPDWVYGGRNLLGNPGLEDSPCRPEVNEIRITASSGSFFLSNGTDTTDSIDITTVTSSGLENALEDVAFGPVVDDVNIPPAAGTPADPFVLTMIDPCQGPGFPLTVIEDPGDPWVGGTVDLIRTQFGALIPSPWQKSQTISDGTPVIHGDYVSFRVTTAEAHTGTFSLLIDPAVIGRRYAGAQQVLNVKRGGIYQASVWVKTNSASQEYRFVIRGVDEDLLLDTSGNPALLQMTLTSGVWTLFSIPNVDVGDNDRIILRIANINPTGNPAIFYVDDGAFDEGMAATTVGTMLEELYDDATADHPPRVVWEDEALGTPYLSLDFDGTNDSDGVPWDRSDVSLTFRPRMSYLQVMQTIVTEGGYEWRIVPDATPGYYLWQVFNPGTLGGSVPAAVLGGQSDTTRSARYFAPSATDMVVQGQNQLSSRASDAGLVGVFGRIEGSELDQNITSLTSAAAAASSAVAENRTGAEDLVYTLANPSQTPLIAYRPGDTILLDDPPLISGQRRVSQIQISVTKQRDTEFVVHFSDAAPFRSLGGVTLSRGLTGPAAVNNAVVGLLRKFDNPDPLPAPAAVEIGGGGGEITISISAVTSSGISQGKTDFIWNVTTNVGGLMSLLGTMSSGLVRWAESRFPFDGHMDVPDGWDFEGAGLHATRLEWSGAPDITFLGNNGLRHISFRDNSS